MRITVTIDDALYEDALQFAPPGITQAELICEALKTFVRIESAKRLAALGGSTPDLQEPPRHKP